MVDGILLAGARVKAHYATRPVFTHRSPLAHTKNRINEWVVVLPAIERVGEDLPGGDHLVVAVPAEIHHLRRGNFRRKLSRFPKVIQTSNSRPPIKTVSHCLKTTRRNIGGRGNRIGPHERTNA